MSDRVFERMAAETEESFVCGVHPKGEVSFALEFRHDCESTLASLPTSLADETLTVRRHPLWPRAWRFSGVMTSFETKILEVGTTKFSATVTPTSPPRRLWVWPDVRGWLRSLFERRRDRERGEEE